MTTHPAGPSAIALPSHRVIPFTPWRWALAAFGLFCVAAGAIGVVVPGLPTTIFLILASWAFAKSCPWLESRLIRNRFFRPFLVYLEPGVRMPPRAKAIALAMMWTAIAISSAILLTREWLIVPPVLLAGLVGTWFIARR